MANMVQSKVVYKHTIPVRLLELEGQMSRHIIIYLREVLILLLLAAGLLLIQSLKMDRTDRDKEARRAVIS